MKITTMGVDLAKNVLQIHGVDERGKTGRARSNPSGTVCRLQVAGLRRLVTSPT